MSVVRMELEVPDDVAPRTANTLMRIYGAYGTRAPWWPAGCTGVMVEVLSDGEIRRERALLAAAGRITP